MMLAFFFFFIENYLKYWLKCKIISFCELQGKSNIATIGCSILKDEKRQTAGHFRCGPLACNRLSLPLAYPALYGHKN